MKMHICHGPDRIKTRTLNTCQFVVAMDNYMKSACQRHTLYVSFRSLGWQVCHVYYFCKIVLSTSPGSDFMRWHLCVSMYIHAT